MNRLLTAAAVLLLSACASDRFYPSGAEDGGRYYLGEYPAGMVRYRATYSPLYAYGVYPWWGYTYYSPYYYPHFFSVRYTPWPYYAAWPHYYAYADWPYGYLPYSRHRHYHPAFHPGAAMPPAQPPGLSGPPPGLPGGSYERMRMLDDRSLWRETRYGSMPAAQRGAGRPAGRYEAPPTSSRSSAFGAGRGASSSPYGSRPGPAVGAPSSPASGRTSFGPAARRNPGLRDQ